MYANNFFPNTVNSQLYSYDLPGPPSPHKKGVASSNPKYASAFNTYTSAYEDYLAEQAMAARMSQNYNYSQQGGYVPTAYPAGTYVPNPMGSLTPAGMYATDMNGNSPGMMPGFPMGRMPNSGLVPPQFQRSLSQNAVGPTLPMPLPATPPIPRSASADGYISRQRMELDALGRGGRNTYTNTQIVLPRLPPLPPLPQLPAMNISRNGIQFDYPQMDQKPMDQRPAADAVVVQTPRGSVVSMPLPLLQRQASAASVAAREVVDGNFRNRENPDGIFPARDGVDGGYTGSEEGRRIRSMSMGVGTSTGAGTGMGAREREMEIENLLARERARTLESERDRERYEARERERMREQRHGQELAMLTAALAGASAARGSVTGNNGLNSGPRANGPPEILPDEFRVPHMRSDALGVHPQSSAATSSATNAPSNAITAPLGSDGYTATANTNRYSSAARDPQRAAAAATAAAVRRGSGVSTTGAGTGAGAQGRGTTTRRGRGSQAMATAVPATTPRKSICRRLCVMLVLAHILVLLAAMGMILAVAMWPGKVTTVPSDGGEGDGEGNPDNGDPGIIVVSGNSNARDLLLMYVLISACAVAGIAGLLLCSAGLAYYTLKIHNNNVDNLNNAADNNNNGTVATQRPNATTATTQRTAANTTQRGMVELASVNTHTHTTTPGTTTTTTTAQSNPTSSIAWTFSRAFRAVALQLSFLSCLNSIVQIVVIAASTVYFTNALPGILAWVILILLWHVFTIALELLVTIFPNPFFPNPSTPSIPELGLSPSESELLNPEERALGSVAIALYDVPLPSDPTAGDLRLRRLRLSKVRQAPLSKGQITAYTRLHWWTGKTLRGGSANGAGGLGDEESCAICLCPLEAPAASDIAHSTNVNTITTLSTAAAVIEDASTTAARNAVRHAPRISSVVLPQDLSPTAPPTSADLVRTLPCLHTFHKACAEHWLLTRPCCPLCREHVVLAGRRVRAFARAANADGKDVEDVEELDEFEENMRTFEENMRVIEMEIELEGDRQQQGAIVEREVEAAEGLGDPWHEDVDNVVGGHSDDNDDDNVDNDDDNFDNDDNNPNDRIIIDIGDIMISHTHSGNISFASQPYLPTLSTYAHRSPVASRDTLTHTSIDTRTNDRTLTTFHTPVFTPQHAPHPSPLASSLHSPMHALPHPSRHSSLTAPLHVFPQSPLHSPLHMPTLVSDANTGTDTSTGASSPAAPHGSTQVDANTGPAATTASARRQRHTYRRSSHDLLSNDNTNNINTDSGNTTASNGDNNDDNNDAIAGGATTNVPADPNPSGGRPSRRSSQGARARRRAGRSSSTGSGTSRGDNGDSGSSITTAASGGDSKPNAYNTSTSANSSTSTNTTAMSTQPLSQRCFPLTAPQRWYLRGFVEPIGLWVEAQGEGEYAQLQMQLSNSVAPRGGGTGGTGTATGTGTGMNSSVWATNVSTSANTTPLPQASTPSAVRRHSERMALMARLQRRQYLENQLAERDPEEVAARRSRRRGTSDIMRECGLLRGEESTTQGSASSRVHPLAETETQTQTQRQSQLETEVEEGRQHRRSRTDRRSNTDRVGAQSRARSTTSNNANDPNIGTPAATSASNNNNSTAVISASDASALAPTSAASRGLPATSTAYATFASFASASYHAITQAAQSLGLPAHTRRTRPNSNIDTDTGTSRVYSPHLVTSPGNGTTTNGVQSLSPMVQQVLLSDPVASPVSASGPTNGTGTSVVNIDGGIGGAAAPDAAARDTSPQHAFMRDSEQATGRASRRDRGRPGDRSADGIRQCVDIGRAAAEVEDASASSGVDTDIRRAGSREVGRRRRSRSAAAQAASDTDANVRAASGTIAANGTVDAGPPIAITSTYTHTSTSMAAATSTSASDTLLSDSQRRQHSEQGDRRARRESGDRRAHTRGESMTGSSQLEAREDSRLPQRERPADESRGSMRGDSLSRRRRRDGQAATDRAQGIEGRRSSYDDSNDRNVVGESVGARVSSITRTSHGYRDAHRGAPMSLDTLVLRRADSESEAQQRAALARLLAQQRSRSGRNTRRKRREEL